MKPTHSGLVLGVVMLAVMVAGCATPLFQAAERGDAQAVRTLLDQGAPINETSDGETALNVAAGKGHTDVVRLLLDRGANVNLRNRYGTPAILKAAIDNHLDVIELLRARGADINAKDDSGATALHQAAGNGQPRIAQFLLERGADVNVRYTNPISDKYWSKATPLHMAARKGHAEIVQMLLAHGAECCQADGHGKTPLKMAQEEGHVTTVRLLQQAEAQQLGTTPPVASSPAVVSPAPPPAASVPASDVDKISPVKVKVRPNAYAIVVGVETYRNKLPKADYAAHDAKIVGDYLTKVMGYQEENVAVLLNEHAAKSDLEKYIEKWLPNRAEPGSAVFVYYSGHGAPNPKTGDAYLVPYDGDPSFVEETGYSLKRLYARLGKLPAKEVVVMLDSCFSGAGGRSVIAKGMRPMGLSIENPVVAGGKTVVLAASAGDQVSSTYDQKSHGLLTYFFLKGLRGDADNNKDGSVDLSEVFAYVKPQVERAARRDFNNEQTPQLLGSPELLAKGIRLVERAAP